MPCHFSNEGKILNDIFRCNRTQCWRKLGQNLDNLWREKKKIARGLYYKPFIMLWYYSTYDRIQLTSLDTQISSYIRTPLGVKTTLSRSHFEDDSFPYISGSGSLIWIKTMFVLFKCVSLIWINDLETRSRWDNTSCSFYGRNLRISIISYLSLASLSNLV